ncbi:MAG: fumarate hydratase C-terminal domain-containing protein [Oscillospiraceae bacterium]|nr:fumarate hydratase C-terminal domain-containing protein [Oscillospiraceae bacterium]
MAQRVFNITTEQLKDSIPQLSVGDRVYLSGTVYTARDAAHKRIFQLLDAGVALPFPIGNSIVYYAGPTPAKNGMAVGSCGPTTSSRMDAFSPRLLDLGMIAMIGKGDRSQEVIDAVKRNGAIYLCAVGGAGALIAKCITAAEEIAFQELGCESVKKLTISELPLIVGIDASGNSIFERN